MLIDSEALGTRIKNKAVMWTIDEDGICGGTYGYTNVDEHIEKQPCAFDKEKVIEQIEDYLFEKYCIEGDGLISDIIQKGGI